MNENRAKAGKATWFGGLELRLLGIASRRLPAGISPGRLIWLGLAGALLVFCGFALSNVSPSALFLSFFGFIVHWFGEQLRVSLAGDGKIEARRIDMYLSKIAELLSAVAIMIGIGISPWVRMDLALSVLAIYLLLGILDYLRAGVMDQGDRIFNNRGGFARLLAALALTLWMAFASPSPVINWLGGLSIFDCYCIIGVICGIGAWFVGTTRAGVHLSNLEPPPQK